MKLPNAERAVVEREKVVDYLLNAAHPDNGGKAQFFEGLGFRREEWRTLAAAFRTLACNAEVTGSMESPHGRKYIMVGKIKSPSGIAPRVQTVWIVDSGSEAARLVTAYPYEQ